jgi:ADP-ribose pyrophosphatase
LTALRWSVCARLFAIGQPWPSTRPSIAAPAVLIALIEDAGGYGVTSSRRSENLAAHSGQIAFPGGRVEEGESLEAAATREAEEEVGIPSARVEILGRLDDLITNSGFLVAPFVGVIEGRVDYILQATEVDEVFEVPLETLMAEGQPEVRYVEFRSKRYPAYYYLSENHEIWGLTGRILKGFLDLVWQSV